MYPCGRSTDGGRRRGAGTVRRELDAARFRRRALNRAAADSEHEIQRLNDGDGAKFVFVLLFGWVVPALIVALAWVFHCWLIPRIRGMGSNKPFQPIARETARSG